MTLPNFIIAGASKSGTTSLHMYLRDHPQIVMSNPKEPYFFCGPNKDIKKYKTIFNADDKENPKVVGESTSVYLNLPKSPERIRKILGQNTKLIFLLRNPRDRAISAYFHMYKRDGDKRSQKNALTFSTINKEEVIDLESKYLEEGEKRKKIDFSIGWKVEDDPQIHFHYIRNSFYSNYIRNFYEQFPKENFLFLFCEDLKENPEEVLKKVEKFLGVKEFIPKGINVQHNQTFAVNKNPLSKGMNKVAPFIAKYVDVNIRPLRRLYNFISGTKTYTAEKETKDYLDKLFEKEKEDISNLIGKDVTKFWN